LEDVASGLGLACPGVLALGDVLLLELLEDELLVALAVG
jgi:hypothetical protein